MTKLLVALSCLVAYEEGTLALDDAVGPPGSTLAHLLAHASGLPFEGTQPVAPPARRRIYSNSGIELAASHLEARSGLHFGDYLQVGVLSPLGMSGTFLEGSPAHGASGPLVDLLALAAELVSPTLISGHDLAGGHNRGLARPGRRATRLRSPGPVRLGPGAGDPGPQGAALDGRRATRPPRSAISASRARCSGSTPAPAWPWPA